MMSIFLCSHKASDCPHLLAQIGKKIMILCRHKAIKTIEKGVHLLFNHKKSPSIKTVMRGYSTTKMQYGTHNSYL